MIKMVVDNYEFHVDRIGNPVFPEKTVLDIYYINLPHDKSILHKEKIGKWDIHEILNYVKEFIKNDKEKITEDWLGVFAV